MEGHLEPPSPAPSPDMLGLNQMIGHDDTGVFPDPGMRTRKAAGAATSQTHVHYDSPLPYHATMDFGKAGHAYSFQAEVAYMQPRAYTTPQTSPPIVTRPSASPARRTIRVSKPSQRNSAHSRGNRISKPKPKKKKKEGRTRDQEEGPIIPGPLTELAGEYPDVKIEDIAAFVERSREERLKEVAQDRKTPGKIKRPMNSFMLYRKAYQNLAKALSKDYHHNVISKAVGRAWKMEPEHVRQQFENWSEIEKKSHRHTYPNYKFSPAKSERKSRKERNQSEDRSMLDDPDWVPERQAKGNRSNSRHGQVAGAEAMPTSIFAQIDPHESPDPGMLQTPAPPPYSGAPPPPYDNTSAAGAQYYQQNIHHAMPGRTALVEDAMLRGTPPPAAYGGEQDAYYGRPSQYPPIAQHGVPEQVIDPALVAGPDSTRYDYFYGGFSVDADRQWQGRGVPGNGAPVLQDDSMAPLDSVLAQDPQLGYLKGNEGSWQLEEVGEQQHQFDGWAT